MQYTINGVDSFLPTGSVLAYIGSLTTDPPGWIIADGNQRDDSFVYNKLIDMSIGTRANSKYTPPKLNGAFLRAVGTKDSYTGPDKLVQQSHAIKTHTHTMEQVPHTHDTIPSMKNPDGTNNPFRGTSTSGALRGLAKIHDGSAPNINGTVDNNVTLNTATNNTGFDPNTKSVSGIKIVEASAPIITVEEPTGINVDGTETTPFSYGVYWIIKI